MWLFKMKYNEKISSLCFGNVQTRGSYFQPHPGLPPNAHPASMSPLEVTRDLLGCSALGAGVTISPRQRLDHASLTMPRALSLFPLFFILWYAGLSLLWPLPLRSTGSGRAGPAAVAHGPSRSAACGIFPDRGTNPCPLHQQADSQPLSHQGSP